MIEIAHPLAFRNSHAVHMRMGIRDACLLYVCACPFCVAIFVWFSDHSTIIIIISSRSYLLDDDDQQLIVDRAKGIALMK